MGSSACSPGAHQFESLIVLIFFFLFTCQALPSHTQLFSRKGAAGSVNPKTTFVRHMPTKCFTDYDLVIRNTHDSLHAAQNTQDPNDLECVQHETHAVVNSKVLCESLNYVYNVKPQLIRGSSDPEKVWTHITRDFKRRGLPFCVFLATASNPQVQMLQEWISANAKRLGLLVDDYYAMVLKMNEETNEWRRNVKHTQSKHLIRLIDNTCHDLKNDLCNGNGLVPHWIKCNPLENENEKMSQVVAEKTNGWKHEDVDYSRLVDDSIRVLHEGFQMVLSDCVLEFRRKMVRDSFYIADCKMRVKGLYPAS